MAGLNIQPIAVGIDAGTKVQLIDNTKEAVVQVFPGAIFGDVNGDGSVTVSDSGIVVIAENHIIRVNQKTGLAFDIRVIRMGFTENRALFIIQLPGFCLFLAMELKFQIEKYITSFYDKMMLQTMLLFV